MCFVFFLIIFYTSIFEVGVEPNVSFFCYTSVSLAVRHYFRRPALPSVNRVTFRFEIKPPHVFKFHNCPQRILALLFRKKNYDRIAKGNVR